MKLVITRSVGAARAARRRARARDCRAAGPDPHDAHARPRSRRSRRAASPFATPIRGAATLRAAFAGGERLLLVSATDLGHRIAQHQAAIDAAKAAGVRHVDLHVGVEARAAEPGRRRAEPLRDGASARAQRPRVDDPAQQPVCRLSSTRGRASDRIGRARAQPRRAARSRTWRARIVRPWPPPCSSRPGMSGAVLRDHGAGGVLGRRARGAVRAS